MDETITRDDARARVAKGAALLDQQRPGWVDEIDLHRLRLDQSCSCILGQLCGSYTLGVHRLLTCSYEAAVAYGFERRDFRGVGSIGDELLAYEAEYRALQDAWIEAIADRVAAGLSLPDDSGSVSSDRDIENRHDHAALSSS